MLQRAREKREVVRQRALRQEQRGTGPEERDVVQVRHLQDDERQDVLLEVELRLPAGTALGVRAADAGPQPAYRFVGEEGARVVPGAVARFVVVGPGEGEEPGAAERDDARGLRAAGPVDQGAVAGLGERAAAALGQVQDGVDGGEAHAGAADDGLGAAAVRVQLHVHRVGVRDVPGGAAGGRAAPGVVVRVAGEQQHLVGRVPVAVRGDHAELRAVGLDVHDLRAVQVELRAGVAAQVGGVGVEHVPQRQPVHVPSGPVLGAEVEIRIAGLREAAPAPLVQRRPLLRRTQRACPGDGLVGREAHLAADPVEVARADLGGAVRLAGTELAGPLEDPHLQAPARPEPADRRRQPLQDVGRPGPTADQREPVRRRRRCGPVRSLRGGHVVPHSVDARSWRATGQFWEGSRPARTSRKRSTSASVMRPMVDSRKKSRASRSWAL